MPMQPGTRLGPYEILSPLGAGGMGEVYRARDTRLERTVAIKVLPSHLAADPSLRERFEREARAVSSLTHPNICSLYDIGRHEGLDFLVMEHIEGETLASRLMKGPLPTEQALRIAVPIADALDKAHRQGVVHRDLKPGNIMLTKSGAKLLDFGLAKLRPAEPGGGVAGSSTLLTQRRDLTAEGSIVGTLQYMAPEQLEGKEADARSDLFSFGAVLYEMVTGKKAFDGKSQASVIASILTSEPQPISAIQPMTPSALDRVVRGCLAKDPDERWQSAHDLMNQLKWIAEGGSQAENPAVPTRRRSGERLAWATAAVLGLSVVWLALVVSRRGLPVEPPSVRFTIPPPEKTTYDLTLAVSPDGRRMAFVANQGGKRYLWLRSLNAIEARVLADTEGATMPFWSPDSRQIGFFADGKLRKVDTADGSIQSLANVTDPRGGSWSREGLILFAPATTTSIFRIAASGGEPAPATTLDIPHKESSHRWPFFLPDGRHFLYFARSGDKDAEGTYVASLDSPDRTRLVSCHSAASFVSPGYLLFVREKTLMAQKLDASRLELSGEAVAVAQNVELIGENGPSAYAAFSASDDGLLGYHQSGTNQLTQLIWFDRGGKQLEAVGPPGFFDEPSLSPDGKRVAVTRTDPKSGTSSVWVSDLSRGTLSRFTFGSADDATPIWSPDGGRIAYASNRSGFWDLYWRPSNGVAAEETLLQTSTNKFADDWSSDGRTLAYEESDPASGTDIWLLPTSGDRKPKPYLQTRFNETHVGISPDGRWIAYASDESGRSEIYVQTFPTPGGKFQISTEGGDEPLWRRDGRELYFVSQDGKLMSVEVGAGPTFEAGAPKALFEVRFPATGLTGARIRYAATADGQRFLVDTFAEEAGASPIVMVTNWSSEIRK